MALSEMCRRFILNKIRIAELERDSNGEENSSVSSLCENILNEMRNLTLEEIADFIKSENVNEINSMNIPQFSSFYNGTILLIERLRMAGNYGPTFMDLGEQFLGAGKKKGAYVKYGENHAKLAQLYDLTYIYKKDISRVYLSTLGRMVESLDINEQKELLPKLSFKIPIIQKCVKDDIKDVDMVTRLLMEYLSETTALRRKSNVLTILKILI